MAPSSVISRSASVLSKGAGKFKKKVTKLIKSISSVGSRKSKSAPSVVSDKAAESDAGDKHAKWTSPVYTFFDDNVETVMDAHDGRKYQAFHCKAPGGCKSKSDFHGVKRYQTTINGDPHSDRSSTSNLKKHAKNCWGSDVVDARIKGVAADAARDGSIFAAFARSGQRPVNVSHRTHTQPEFRARIIRWITEANRPLKIVQDRQLQDLLTAGRPELKVPSRSTVARDLKAVYERSADRVKKLLQEYDGRLSFATDAWTSPNHRAFVAWTVHLQHEGEPLVFLLDIFEVPESHTGQVLAREFDDMLRRFGLQRKILAWAGDNASSNDTQNIALDMSSENDFDAVNHVRCFNHTTNLAVKAFMRPFQPRPKRKDSSGNVVDADDDADLEEPILDLDLDDDDASMPDLDALSETASIASDDVEGDAFDELGEQKQAEMLQETKEAKKAISLLRKLAFALINSTTIGLPAWRRACVKHDLRVRYIPRDVPTRWNSTYDMMVFAVRYKAAINDITGDRDLNYRLYDLSNDNWLIIEDMVHTLEVFKRATLLFSSDEKSTIANVITTMDKIDDLLTSTIVSSSGRRPIHKQVRKALNLAKTTLNKYYSRTDTSNVYRIAMVLHPSLKLEYFRLRKWEQAWIDLAEQLVKDEFDLSYNSPDADNDIEIVDGGDAVSVSSSTVELDLAADWFFDINIPSTRTGKSELEQYLADPIVPGVRDPLKWWWAKRDVWPKLSRMALDYHSIPSTSTSVERVFSQGRHILSFSRNRLTGASIRRFMCLGSWSRKDLVRDDDAIKAVKQQMKGKGKEKEVVKRKRGESDDGEGGAGKKARPA